MTVEQAPADRRSRDAEEIRARSRISAAARLRHAGAQAASTCLQRGALILAFLALIACFSFLRPATFFTLANLESTLGTQAAAALVALGVTIALLAGEYDLSVTATMGTSATVVAFLTTIKHMPVLDAVGIV